MIQQIEGWKLVREKYAEDGKPLDLDWINVDAGYDTATVIVHISRTSIARWKQFSVIAKIERGGDTIVFGRVDNINTPSDALALAYGFMKRNKYIVRLK